MRYLLFGGGFFPPPATRGRQQLDAMGLVAGDATQSPDLRCGRVALVDVCKRGRSAVANEHAGIELMLDGDDRVRAGHVCAGLVRRQGAHYGRYVMSGSAVK